MFFRLSSRVAARLAVEGLKVRACDQRSGCYLKKTKGCRREKPSGLFRGKVPKNMTSTPSQTPSGMLWRWPLPYLWPLQFSAGSLVRKLDQIFHF